MNLSHRALEAAIALLAAHAGGPATLAGQCSAPGPLSVQPVRYELELRVDYEREAIEGDVRLTVANRGEDTTGVVPLVLYRLMEVGSIRDERGGELEFSQRVVSFEDWPQLQVTFVEVPLAEPLPPGGERALLIHYGGYLLGYSETGMRYVRDRVDPEFTIIRPDAYAYPKVGVPCLGTLRATGLTYYDYRVSVSVPDSMVVANGGELVRRSVVDGRATYTYRSTGPAWRMDIAIADYGLLTSGDTRVYYLPGDSAGAARVLEAVDKSFALFSEWFGPLGKERGLTIIEIPDGWGSQKDEATIIQAAAAFRDPERLSEVYHEVSHFGNVPDLDRPSPRWNEGLASFLEELAVERLQGEEVLERRVEAVTRWLTEMVRSRPRLKEIPLAEYGRHGMTDFSYSVGMVFFAALYELVGQDGFERIVGDYYRRYAAGGATLDEFAAHAIREGRPGLKELFDDWVFTTRWTDVLTEQLELEGIVALYREE